MLRDEQKEQAAKLKDRPFKEKLSYFWTYHKGPVIAAIVIIIFAVGIFQTSGSYDRNALQVIITDHMGGDIQTEALTSLYESSSDDSGAINFNTGLWLTSDNYEATAAYVQKLIAMLNANGIDIFIAPESVFEQYGRQGMFTDLNTLLSEDDMAQLDTNSRIFYTELDSILTETDETNTDDTTIAAGLRLNDSQLLADAGIQVDAPCIGIPATAAHPEEALRFLHIFLQEDK